MKIHLLDLLPEAKVDAPSENHVLIQPITIHRSMRSSIFQHPNSTIIFGSSSGNSNSRSKSALKLGKNSTLSFAVGIKELVWEKIKSPVTFQIEVIAGKIRHLVFNETIDVSIEADRKWHERKIDLRSFDNQVIELILTTKIGGSGERDGSYAWSGWADPVLESELKTNHPVWKRPGHNVFLIVADALRRDFLSCYGHPQVKTPNIDALALDGCLVADARAQSPSTLGSLTSMMTGLNPFSHGVDREWGQIPPGLSSLPGMLAGLGYRTVAALSEKEYGEGAGGLRDLFQDCIATLGTPMQAGDVTTRRFLSWLDNHYQESARQNSIFKKDAEPANIFAWIHYFDCHPPSMAPESFKWLYYQGDPTASERSYLTEKIKNIHGAEVVLEFEAQLLLLRQGTYDSCLPVRLRDTALVLAGKSSNSPDLADHLKGLGAVARLGMSNEDFSAWLLERVSDLEQGEFAELLLWLDEVMPLLRSIEQDNLDWLKGVVDFRYPLAQYMSSVTYLDHHIGNLVAALKERNLYDNSTIVFVSSHGELLGEDDLTFHHIALREETIRQPLIIKQSKLLREAKRSTTIEGIFDEIDLFPTLLEMVGGRLQAAIDGYSRAREILGAKNIAEHESFSVDYLNEMISVTSRDYTFLKAFAPKRSTASWTWQTGQTGLYRRSQSMSYHDVSDEHPELVKLYSKKMADWLKQLN